MDTHPLELRVPRAHNCRVLVADDEAPARRELHRILLAADQTLLIEEAENGLEVLEKVRKDPPEVLFLDIQMPGLDGIQTTQEVKKILPSCIIVFVTAFTDYAVKAFEVHAIDYLMKPIRPERLHQTLERIKERRTKPEEMVNYATKLAHLISTLEYPLPSKENKEPPKERISVYVGESIIPINIGDIIYVESKGRCASITTKRGTFQTHLPLYELEAILTPPKFFMTHRSYIVQIEEIESIELWVNNTYRLIMKNSDIYIPVSRGKINEFKQIMNV